MVYRVKDLMTKDIVGVSVDDTVAGASKVMVEKQRGYALVLKEGRPVGIVTERDLVWKVVAKEMEPSKVKVGEIMASPLITVDPDADLGTAAEIMEKSHIRRLPVLRGDILYGVITSRDIVRYFNEYVKRAVLDVVRFTVPTLL
jgi:CBS domain-containing protein